MSPMLLDNYEEVYRKIANDPTKTWNAAKIVAGTLTSQQQINGTPVVTFNLNNGQLILSDGTARRMLIGFGKGLF